MVDKLQSRIRTQLREYVEEKDLTEFEAAVIDADDLESALEKAKKKSAGVYDADYARSKSLMILWQLEIGLLSTIAAGIKPAIQIQTDAIIELNKQADQIRREAKDTILIDPKVTTKKARQAQGKRNKAAKAEMIERIKSLRIKSLRLGPLADLKTQLARIELSIKALSSRSKNMFPIEPVKSNHPVVRSPLDQVDYIKEALKEHAKKMSEKYEDPEEKVSV